MSGVVYICDAPGGGWLAIHETEHGDSSASEGPFSEYVRAYGAAVEMSQRYEAVFDELANTSVATPRGSLVFWMLTAEEHLQMAVAAVAANNIDGLRRAFVAFSLNSKAAADTLEAAIKQMRMERQ